MRPILLSALAACTFCLPLAMPRATEAAGTTYVRSYRVEVQWYLWKSGYLQWRTEFESTDYQEAKLVYDLLAWARDQDELFDVLCDELESWVPVDVRLRTVYTPLSRLYERVDAEDHSNLLRNLEIRSIR